MRPGRVQGRERHSPSGGDYGECDPASRPVGQGVLPHTPSKLATERASKIESVSECMRADGRAWVSE